mgnify:CR=1 FL=1
MANVVRKLYSREIAERAIAAAMAAIGGAEEARAATAQRRDEAEANLRAAEGQTRAAKAQLDMAEAGARSEDKAAAAAQAQEPAFGLRMAESRRLSNARLLRELPGCLHYPTVGHLLRTLAP